MKAVFVFLFFFFFLGPHLRHMEVPRLEVQLELQLPAYTTATATQDPSHVCNLHHSHSNSGSKPRLQPTPQLMATLDRSPTEQGQGSNLSPVDTSRVHLQLSHNGIPRLAVLNKASVCSPSKCTFECQILFQVLDI